MAKQSNITPERKAFLGRVAERIKTVMKAKENDTYLPETLMSLPHKTGQQYKTAPIKTSIEYALAEVFVGGRGQIICQFEPVDNQDFDLVDVEQAKIDNIFPTFAPNYAELIGSDAEDMPALVHLTELALLEEDRQAIIAKEEEKAEADTLYVEHPLFGAF